MKPTHASDRDTPGLTQFQIEADAAESYERWVVPFVLGPWAPALLDIVELRVGERVLDVATGTGVVARLAARRVAPAGLVTGLDLNAGMLEVARRMPLPPGLTIDWRQGSALDLPFADGAFDVVLCQQGLQFFPDKPKALGEMRRVVTSAGRIAVSVWTGSSPYSSALREALERYVGTEAAVSGAVARSLGDADELCGLLNSASFRDVVVHHVRMTIRLPPPEEFVLRHLSATPAARFVAGAGEQARAQLVAHVKEATRAYVDGYGLAVPEQINVATGGA